MGKRSNFERIERDFYPTPYEAVISLLPHLSPKTEFVEPCAGDGALIRHLEKHGHKCKLASDIEPKLDMAICGNMFDINYKNNLVITNPPWERGVLHGFIGKIIKDNAHAWLLFDADWMHTKQSTSYMDYCNRIVSIGRVKWIASSKQTGKDNCCWYKFCGTPYGTTKFFGRQ